MNDWEGCSISETLYLPDLYFWYSVDRGSSQFWTRPSLIRHVPGLPVVTTLIIVQWKCRVTLFYFTPQLIAPLLVLRIRSLAERAGQFLENIRLSCWSQSCEKMQYCMRRLSTLLRSDSKLRSIVGYIYA